jgi:hypothetical protein
MTFEEWWKDVPNKDDTNWKLLVYSAWHAGFYQGRLHEGGNNIAKQIDDEILGILKSAQETEK